MYIFLKKDFELLFLLNREFSALCNNYEIVLLIWFFMLDNRNDQKCRIWLNCADIVSFLHGLEFITAMNVGLVLGVWLVVYHSELEIEPQITYVVL